MPTGHTDYRTHRSALREVFRITLVLGALAVAAIVAVAFAVRRHEPTRLAHFAAPTAELGPAHAVAGGDRAALAHAARALCRFEDPRHVGRWPDVERFRMIAAAVERGEYNAVWPTFSDDVVHASERLGRLTDATVELHDHGIRTAVSDLSTTFVMLSLAIGDGDFSRARERYEEFCGEALHVDVLIREYQHR